MITFDVKETVCKTASLKNMIQNYLATRLFSISVIGKSNAVPPILRLRSIGRPKQFVGYKPHCYKLRH